MHAFLCQRIRSFCSRYMYALSMYEQLMDNDIIPDTP